MHFAGVGVCKHDVTEDSGECVCITSTPRGLLAHFKRTCPLSRNNTLKSPEMTLEWPAGPTWCGAQEAKRPRSLSLSHLFV